MSKFRSIDSDWDEDEAIKIKIDSSSPKKLIINDKRYSVCCNEVFVNKWAIGFSGEITEHIEKTENGVLVTLDKHEFKFDECGNITQISPQFETPYVVDFEPEQIDFVFRHDDDFYCIKNKNLHNENDLPAVQLKDKKIWMQNNLIHRDGGPAFISEDQEWWFNQGVFDEEKTKIEHALKSIPTEDIQKTAYLLWEQKGRQDGQEQENWNEARMLLGKESKSAEIYVVNEKLSEEVCRTYENLVADLLDLVNKQ